MISLKRTFLTNNSKHTQTIPIPIHARSELTKKIVTNGKLYFFSGYLIIVKINQVPTSESCLVMILLEVLSKEEKFVFTTKFRLLVFEIIKFYFVRIQLSWGIQQFPSVIIKLPSLYRTLF